VSVWLTSLLLTAGDVASAVAQGSDATVATDEPRTFWDSFSVIPVPFYTPETSLGLGMYLINTFEGPGNGPDDRRSSVQVGLMATLKKQFVLWVAPELWMGGDRHLVRLELVGQFDQDTFYGIGANTRARDAEDYRSESAGFMPTYLQRVWRSLLVGGHAHLRRNRTDDLEPGGLLDTGDLLGVGSSWVVGAGPSLAWDSRDSTFWPTRGGFHSAQVTFADEALGSTFDFTRSRIDLRQFMPIWLDHVLGLQARSVLARGDVPFYALAAPGGGRMHRGWYRGRHRDRNALAFQVEYRAPIWWRLGAVAFASTSQVAHEVGGLDFADSTFAGGGGIRFAVLPRDKVNMRLDVAYGDGESVRVYLQVPEAF